METGSTLLEIAAKPLAELDVTPVKDLLRRIVGGDGERVPPVYEASFSSAI